MRRLVGGCEIVNKPGGLSVAMNHPNYQKWS